MRGFSEEEQAIKIPEEFMTADCRILISNYGRESVKVKELRPYETLVIYHK